ncbi:unnamed protein product [Diamesa tonsa]
MESLESSLSSILCNDSFNNQDHWLEIDQLHDKPANELNIMKKNSGMDYGTSSNSHSAVKRRYYNYNKENDAMSHVPHYTNQRSVSSAYGYDPDWSNIVINDNMNFKKILKSKIHLKKPKLERPSTKPRTTIEIYLRLKEDPVIIDLNKTGIFQRPKLENISDSKIMLNAVNDWSFFLSRLCNDRKVVERDFFYYYFSGDQVDFTVMIRNKSLEDKIAFMIDRTKEEAGNGSNFILFIHEYCKEQGISFEASQDDYWQDVKDSLEQLNDKQSDITSAVVMRNMLNFKGNFNDIVVGKKWMDALNQLVDGIKKLVTYLWMLQIMIKSHNNSKVQ